MDTARVHRIASKVVTAAKVYLYHGTPPKNLKRILSQGLIPDPKDRLWSEDRNEGKTSLSMDSFQGVYLTRKLEMALSSITHVTTRHYGLVVVRVESRTLVPDEDTLIGGFPSSFKSVENPSVLVELYRRVMKGGDDPLILDKANNMFDMWFDERLGATSHLSDRAKKAIREAVMEDVVELCRRYVVRAMAWLVKEQEEQKAKDGSYDTSYYYGIKGLSVEDVPSTQDAKKSFRVQYDKVLRRLKRFAESIESNGVATARSPEGINYKGKNKIVGVFEFKDKEWIVHFLGDQKALKMLIQDLKSEADLYTFRMANGKVLRERVNED